MAQMAYIGQNQETISWNEIVSFLEKNPYQDKKLLPSIKFEELSDDLDLWHIQPVYPPGPLSCVLFSQNLDYRTSSLEGRPVVLRTQCTELQEKASTHLKGRAWPVRRTAEGIVAVSTEELPSKWTDLGLSALTQLYECQLVFFSLDKKTLNFIPKDVRNWSKDKPIYFIQSDARAVWSPPVGFSVKGFGAWIQEKEDDSWIIEWPVCDGTLVELKEKAAGLQMNVGKILREELAKRIGRVEAVRLFASWM